jgi:hypothetical protein
MSGWQRLSNACSLACHWQTHLLDATKDDTSLYTQVQYQRSTGGSYVEKPAQTQNTIWLLSPNLMSLNPLCQDVLETNKKYVRLEQKQKETQSHSFVFLFVSRNQTHFCLFVLVFRTCMETTETSKTVLKQTKKSNSPKKHTAHSPPKCSIGCCRQPRPNAAQKLSSFLGRKWHSPIGSMPFYRAQKTLSFHSNPLPLALVMDLPASKTLRTGPYKS